MSIPTPTRFQRLRRAFRRTLSLCGIVLTVWAALWVSTSLATPQLPSESQPILFYSNQLRQDLNLTFETAIGRAQHSIFLSIYSLTDKRIINSLNERALQGIDIEVVCDASASYGIQEKLAAPIRLTRRDSLGLMHQKILIIDSQEVWMGSANMTAASLRRHGNLVMGVCSRPLASSLQQRLHQSGDEPVEQQSFQIGGNTLDVWLLPENEHALDRLVHLIDTAQKTVRVAMFTWTHPQLTDAVIRAHERGVQTEIVIDYESGSGTSGPSARKLQRYGVPVALSDGMGLLHHKFAWIDDQTLAHGSANWTRSAFGLNDEILTVVHDLNDDQQKLMDRLWRVLQLESIPY